MDLQQQSVPVAGLHLRADDAGGAADHAPEPLPLFGAVQHDFQSQPAKSGKWVGPKRRRTADGEPAAGNANGAILHCGGPVWGLDWSPAVPPQPAGSADGSTGHAAGAASRQDASGAAEPTSSQFLAVRSAHLSGTQPCLTHKARPGPCPAALRPGLSTCSSSTVILSCLQVLVHPRGRESNVIGRPLSGPGCVQLWQARFSSTDSPRCNSCMQSSDASMLLSLQ